MLDLKSEKPTITNLHVSKTWCPPAFAPTELLTRPARRDVQWFPMRVTYNRELGVKAELDELGVESFVPMRYAMVTRRYERKRMLVPAVHNLLFIHSTQTAITALKHERSRLEPLRYMVRRVWRDTSWGTEILRVPDAEMENFMRVASLTDGSTFFIENMEFASKPGRRVLITEGPFAGVRGVIKRIKKNKHVVVHLDDIAAVAIAFVPPKFLMYVD